MDVLRWAVVACIVTALASGRELHANSLCKLDNLGAFEEKIYSQNGEDGVLLRILEAIGTTNKQYVEFGVQDGQECNTRILRETQNFTGLMMDGGNVNPEINLKNEFVTVDNVLKLFSDYKVPESFDVLSVDVDSFDWWLLLRILRDGRYKPRVIIVEVNPTIGVGVAKFRERFEEANTVPQTMIHPDLTDLHTWDLSRYSGANPLAFQKLGNVFGYEMIYCERCGVNCIMIRREAIPDACSTKSIPLASIHYPCYGTARTEGKYPGHEVDLLARRPVRVSDSLLALLVTNTYSLKDVVENLYSPNEEYPLWGSDWCSALLENPFSEKSKVDSSAIGLQTQFSTGVRLFQDKQFVAAKVIFDEIMENVVGRGWICKTNHWSEDGCWALAAVRLNSALSLLNSDPNSSNTFQEAASQLRDAENLISLGLGHSRVKSLVKFVSTLSDIDIKKVATTWFSFITDRNTNTILRRRIDMNICSNPANIAKNYCISNNIPDSACDTIRSSLVATYDKEYISFPNAYYNINHEQTLHDERLSPLVQDTNSFNKNGCFNYRIEKHLSDVQKYCQSMEHVRPLVIVSGLASNAVITAATIVLRSILSIGVVEEIAESPDTRRVMEMDRLAESAKHMDKISRSLFSAFDCTARRGPFHASLADKDCLMRMAREEISSEEQSQALSAIVQDMYSAMYGAPPSDIMVHGDSLITFSHNYWRSVYRGDSERSVRHIFLAPPIEVAVSGLVLDLNITPDAALDRFIFMTNAAIEAFAADPYSSRAIVLAFSDADSSTVLNLAGEISDITSRKTAVTYNSTQFSLRMDILRRSVSLSLPKISVQIPYWFYKCYEAIRLQLFLPNTPCLE